MKRFLFAVFFLLLTSSVWAKSAAELLHDKLSGIQSLRTNFVQTTTDPRLNHTKTISGAAILRRPKMFRWQIEKPYRQLLVADGQKLYIYDEDLAQVTVQRLGDSLKDTPALLLVGDSKQIDEHFTVQELDGGELKTQFKLIPNDESSLLKVVVITFNGAIVTRLWMQDSLDQIIDIQFSEIALNSTLPENLFKFNLPKNVDVIHNDN